MIPLDQPIRTHQSLVHLIEFTGFTKFNTDKMNRKKTPISIDLEHELHEPYVGKPGRLHNCALESKCVSD